MPSIVQLYRRFFPGIIKNLVRAFRLHNRHFNVSEIPDLTYAFEISSFANAQINSHALLKYYFESPSQIHQDLLAHLVCSTKYFVEFGACDGVESSNTFWLEKSHGWGGVLAEPGKNWIPKLLESRDVEIICKAVSSKSGDFLQFAETNNPVYSTFSNLTSSDTHASKRYVYKEYRVETISLEDLLVQAGAPPRIGYLSIDTEGSEFEILNAFNFERFRFELITVEHNFTYNQEKICNLLTSNGYMRILEEVSGGEAWFIDPNFQHN
jgi:FkbM family methyltransferase